jgi:hypothetical protein
MQLDIYAWRNFTVVLIIVCTFLFLFIMWIFTKVPKLMTLVFSKRYILAIGNDGRITPYKAQLQGTMYKTKVGVYSFEKDDVVFMGNKPTIIVLMPYIQAIRPNVSEVLTYFKKHGISRVKEMEAIRDASVISVDEYNKLSTRGD